MFPVTKSELEIVEMWNRLEDDILEVKVPFPKHYPNTKFKQDNNELAYLKIDFSDSKDYVYLLDFYVYSSRLHARSKYANKDEVELTKGLGKRILCYAVSRLIDKNIINKDTAKMRLYAGGGNCESEKQAEDILKKFTLSQMDAWIKNNLNRHPDIVEDLLTLSKKEKATEICAALNNSKLVKYYEQYGLKVDVNALKKLDLSYVPMSGYVYNILKKCSSKDVNNNIKISLSNAIDNLAIKSKSPRRKPNKLKTSRRKPSKSKPSRRKPKKTNSSRRKSKSPRRKYKRSKV